MAEITEGGALPAQQEAGPVGNAAAPFVYFDHAPTFGHLQGAIRIELAADTIIVDGAGSTRTERVWVAHLRCSPAAAAQLRNALDGALAMFQQALQQSLQPPPDTKPN